MTDVVRSRRRTLSSILGVLLAITFIAGTFIAIDSSTRATLDGLISNLSADIGFFGPPSNGTEVREAVEGVPGVAGVRVFRSAQFSEVGSDVFGRVAPASVMGVDPSRLPYSLEGYRLTAGSLTLPRGTIALTEDLASELGLAVGDAAYFQYRLYDYTGNETLTRLNVTVGAILTGSAIPSGSIAGPYFFRTTLVHIEDVDWYESQLAVPWSGTLVQGEVRVDRDRLLDPYDLETSRRNLARLERQIAQALLPHGGKVSFNALDSVLVNFSSVIAIQRIVYLALSAPILLLGLYLGAIGVDLGHAERRRELAVLKTRGAGRRQLVGLLLLEAVLGGLVAAFLGVLAGVGLSRFLLEVVNPFAAPSAPRYDLLVLTPSTIIIAAVLSMIFMALVSFRSARRTANLPIVETLRYHAPGETKIQYKPTLDIIFVALATLTYG
ncbi:MAG: FtsX-like permease family protein, partial [Chloroflexi bacterium]|nr:FtsX-like permease family protein [Chloroflexota bacterium]